LKDEERSRETNAEDAATEPRLKKEEPKQQHNRETSAEDTTNKPGPKPLLWLFEPGDHTKVPPRPWLHAWHYIRRHIVMTVAPGDWGKTTFLLCNAIEMATGRGLLGSPPIDGPYRVAYWNAEDPDDEIERRIYATCLHHGIAPDTLRDQLIIGGMLEVGARIAKLDKRSGEVVLDPKLLGSIDNQVKRLAIDILILDPLIAFHNVPEADNVAMEKVIKSGLGLIAVRNNCCIELAQHTRKSLAGQYGGEITTDDSRGAGAITNAARSVRVLNRMSKEEATLPKILPEERRRYLRIDRGKANMAPPGKATWIHLASVDLMNSDGVHPSDLVQAAESWSYPQPFDGVTDADAEWARQAAREAEYRCDPRSPDWLGRPLARRLKLDPDEEGDRKKVVAILKAWLANGTLATETRKDKERKDREFFVPGPGSGGADADD
jgi:AAA domain-containing protein